MASDVFDHSQDLDGFLSKGQLVQANQHFAGVLQSDPKDSSARVALGLTQFLQAIEGLGQANYRYGLLSKYASMLPIARLPIPINADPEEVSYEDIRSTIDAFETGLMQAEAMFAGVAEDPVKFNFYLGRVRLDLNDDGLLSEEETLWRIFADLNRGVDPAVAENFSVGIDNADIYWLRGYCHVLAAACNFAMAYDESELFERCGQLLFPRAKSRYRYAKLDAEEIGNDFESQILDAIAAIHLMRFPLVDPQKMIQSHEHLLAMVRLSRACWKSALAENDDDREWIPNPKQRGVLGLRVDRELITGWHNVLEELEDLLEGRKLVPYWRLYLRYFSSIGSQIPEEGIGINLHRWFHEPSDFDLVLLLQGTNLEPYFEEGPLSTPEAWRELTGVFQGQFFGFAIWFN